jgi:hypothetical protein
MFCIGNLLSSCCLMSILSDASFVSCKSIRGQTSFTTDAMVIGQVTLHCALFPIYDVPLRFNRTSYRYNCTCNYQLDLIDFVFSEIHRVQWDR